MLIPIIAVITGFIILMLGADRMILGASALARNLGVSPLIIGLTIVGFGTSAPEILVSAVASSVGSTDLAIGNAIGSNITNIALVLGLTSIFIPLEVHSKVQRRELPLLLVTMCAAYAMMVDGSLGRIDGILLLGAMVAMILWVVRMGLKTRTHDQLEDEFDHEIRKDMSTGMATVWFFVGLLALLGGSRILVWGGIEIATALGVSELMIGLTVIAVGTSLPELAASMAGALKGEHDIAVGNIVGSNMFNLLGVMAMPGLIHPGPFSTDILGRDFPLMIALTMALIVMAYGRQGVGRINRIEGGVLLSVYVGYIYLLIHEATVPEVG